MGDEQVVLALDIGSSSVRCSAYTISDKIVAHASQERRSVLPNSGYIALQSDDGSGFMDDIDQVVDEVLRGLSEEYKVCAVGFSSFVMNLIGVDCHGNPVGDDATMSYACQTEEVLTDVEKLKR